MKKNLLTLMLFLGLCLSFAKAKDFKYHPRTKEELKALVNPEINFDKID